MIESRGLRIVASLAGALVCGAICILFVATIGFSFAGEFRNQEILLGLLTMAAGGVAGLVGALLGAFAVWQLTGPARPGFARLFSFGFVAFCVLAAVFVGYREWRARTENRDRYARSVNDGWMSLSFSGLEASRGERLAETIQSCIRTNGPPASADDISRGSCASLLEQRIDAPAPRRPPMLHEDGWRWRHTDDGSGWRVIVAPHPDLKLPGPIFELDRDVRVMRRESDATPAYAAWSGLLLAARYRECLLSAQGQADALGSWKGEWDLLPEKVAETTGCASVTPSDLARVRPRRWLMTLKAVDTKAMPEPIQVIYDAGLRGFTLRIDRPPGAHYLLDTDGGWHVTREPRSANDTDPAPPACETDLSVPCQ